MKPIQLFIEESLLRRLDADPEVKRVGRSEVLLRAASEYLRRSRTRKIAEGYRRAYGKEGGLGEDWAGWEDEGSWSER
jgi:metal-responsive CopG/Arc/MetJ family transcriptional regulator